MLAEGNNNTRFPPDVTYALLERTEHIAFVTKAEAAAKGLFAQIWPSGCLFNATWELSWDRQGDHYLLRLLTEGDLPDGWRGEQFETRPATTLLLFGQRQHDEDRGWREPRIPRAVEYPVPRRLGRVRLIVIPYLRDGMVVRMRMKGVTADA